MIKNILKILILATLLWLNFVSFGANCTYTPWASVWSNIDGCMTWIPLVNPWYNIRINDWFKSIIEYWTFRIGALLAIFAVWSIVFWAFKMVISGWEEEWIKSWKKIATWWAIGFFAVISASAVIRIITELIYSLD